METRKALLTCVANHRFTTLALPRATTGGMPPAKPGDHPDFFRFPAPPGQSRESSIVLDAQGRFWHDGALVEHPGMARAFAGWIGRHPDNGRFILSNDFDWTYFTVRDVPLFVRSVRAVGGAPSAELSDGSE